MKRRYAYPELLADVTTGARVLVDIACEVAGPCMIQISGVRDANVMGEGNGHRCAIGHGEAFCWISVHDSGAAGTNLDNRRQQSPKFRGILDPD